MLKFFDFLVNLAENDFKTNREYYLEMAYRHGGRIYDNRPNAK